MGVGSITPTPDVAAFQVPPNSGGIKVPELLLNKPPSGADVHSRGYAVHVWTNGDQDETDASYRHLYDLGVDGIMTSDPSRLAAFLCANDIPRPDGTPRCTHPAQPLRSSTSGARRSTNRPARRGPLRRSTTSARGSTSTRSTSTTEIFDSAQLSRRA